MTKTRFGLIKSPVCFRVNNPTPPDSFLDSTSETVAVCLVMFMSQIRTNDGQAALVLLGPQSIPSCCNLKPEITGMPIHW